MTLRIIIRGEIRNLIAEFHFAVWEGLMRLRLGTMKPSCRRTEEEIEEDKKQKRGRAESNMTQEKKEDDGEEAPVSSANLSASLPH